MRRSIKKIIVSISVIALLVSLTSAYGVYAKVATTTPKVASTTPKVITKSKVVKKPVKIATSTPVTRKVNIPLLEKVITSHISQYEALASSSAVYLSDSDKAILNSQIQDSIDFSNSQLNQLANISNSAPVANTTLTPSAKKLAVTTTSVAPKLSFNEQNALQLKIGILNMIFGQQAFQNKVNKNKTALPSVLSSQTPKMVLPIGAGKIISTSTSINATFAPVISTDLIHQLIIATSTSDIQTIDKSILPLVMSQLKKYIAVHVSIVSKKPTDRNFKINHGKFTSKSPKKVSVSVIVATSTQETMATTTIDVATTTDTVATTTQDISSTSDATSSDQQ